MNVAEGQKRILFFLKERGEATTAEIASALSVTYEAVRQQLKQMEGTGLIRQQRRANPSGVGRPLRYYSLSVAGDHQFPKEYAALTVTLMDAVSETLGEEALRQVLARISRQQVAYWAPRLSGLTLEERLRALRDFYVEDDPYIEVAHDDGDPQLVERNCPFLNTALARPKLCSVTVSALEQLLGRRVTRERRFQDGDGCCVFRVHKQDVLEGEQSSFRFEEEFA
jgi:predicted ArsR family transcriptional regulator